MTLELNVLISALMGLLIIVGLIFIFITLRKMPQNKGKELGKIIAEQFLLYPYSFLLVVDMLLAVAEAGFAASIGDHFVNPVFRFVGHFTLLVASMFSTINFGKECRRFAVAALEKNWVALGPRFTLIVLYLVMSAGLPFLNAIIIANGLGQMTEVQLALISLTSNEDEFILAATLAGKDMPYAPWQALNYAMLVTLVMTVVHYGVILIKTIKLMDSAILDKNTRFAFEKDDQVAEDPQPDPAAPNANGGGPSSTNPPSNNPPPPSGSGQQLSSMEKILTFVGVNPQQVPSRAKRLVESIERKPQADQAVIAQAMVPLLKDIDKQLAEEQANPANASKRAAIVANIRAVFAKSTRDGGIGHPLPQARGN